MYVKIKKPIDWIGPYQIAQRICFWTKTKDEYGCADYPDWVDNFGNWLGGGEDDSVLVELCRKVHDFREWLNRDKVKIHKYDTWSMDLTLSPIILPMLKQLRDTKHGAPHVDDEDVPEWLKSTSAPAKDNEWDTDDNWHKRWDYVIDCMIWSFIQLEDEDNDAQFHTGVIDNKFVPCEDGAGSVMEKGPKDTHVFHKDAYLAHNERIQNGLRLFGKYYRGLWD